jgi:hypothetical protein
VTVFARDYSKDHGKGASGKKIWAYCFTYEKVRYRKTGFRSKKDAQYAEERRRKEVILGMPDFLPARVASPIRWRRTSPRLGVLSPGTPCGTGTRISAILCSGEEGGWFTHRYALYVAALFRVQGGDGWRGSLYDFPVGGTHIHCHD